MTWKELAAEFNQRFGPDSKNPVVLTWSGRLPDKCGIEEFFNEKLMTKEVKDAHKKAHFTSSLYVDYSKGPFPVILKVTTLQSHPLWDETIQYWRSCISKESEIFTISRKRFKDDGSWGVILKEKDMPEGEIDLKKPWGIRGIEMNMADEYKSVLAIANAMKKLTPDEAIAFKDAAVKLFGMHSYGSSMMELRLREPNQYDKEPDHRRNLYVAETRKRLLDRLALFEGKPVENDSVPEPPLDISLRDYIAGAEILEDGTTCPPELVDDAMDWLLNGHNDLLERLDGIIRDAVHHVVASQCGYSVDGDCQLCPENKPCKGTRAEMSECAYRGPWFHKKDGI